MIQTTYAVFLGILLALFVGVGIAAFYSQPAGPEYPQEQIGYVNKDGLNEQQQKIENEFNIKQKAWEEEMKPYNRNVSVVALASAVVFVCIGLIFDKKIRVLADGAMLGGIFTLIYSLGRGFAAEDSKYSFVMVSVSLAIVIALGYLRFIRPEHHLTAQPVAIKPAGGKKNG